MIGMARLAKSRHLSLEFFPAVRFVVLGAHGLFVLLPFYWLVVNSIRLPLEYLAVPPKIVPSRVTLENYSALFARGSETLLCLTNSVVITICTTVLSLGVGCLAAYGLTRARFPAVVVGAISYAFLLVRFYPKITTVLPYFVIAKKLGMLDTRLSIILAYVGLTLPTVIWLMMTFYEELPRNIEHSAMLDGCGPWQRFRWIVVPISLPGMVASAIFTAILAWIEFLIASSLGAMNAKTLTVAVSSFIVDKGMHWGPMSALGVVCIVPVMIFAGFVQRYLVRGLTFGAVKG